MNVEIIRYYTYDNN